MNIQNNMNDDDYVRFLKASRRLPPDLEEVAVRIADEIRTENPGEQFVRDSQGRFVTRPDNFVTIKPQHRDRSVAITVRQTPDRLPAHKLEVKRSRKSYSRFKVTRAEDTREAMLLIRSARRKRQRKG